MHMRLARERPDGYVMKPQREAGHSAPFPAILTMADGLPHALTMALHTMAPLTMALRTAALLTMQGGGHNFFGDELRAALESMTREQRSAFILMQVRPESAIVSK